MILHHYDKNGRKVSHPHHDWRGASLIIGGLLVLLLIGAGAESLLLDGATIDFWRLIGQAAAVTVGALSMVTWWWIKGVNAAEEAADAERCDECGR